MCRSGKIVEKLVEKVWFSLLISWWGVKKIMGMRIFVCGVVNYLGWWWEKSAQICTGNFISFIRERGSFSGFTHRTITITNLIWENK